MTDKPVVQQPESQPAPRPTTRPIHTEPRRRHSVRVLIIDEVDSMDPDPRITTR